jgi:signal transduction histidine kinase/CheY-like chemotaxis protein/purine-cytosine permease-like protein
MTIAPPPTADRIVAKRQRVVGTRRRYNQWVNNQTLEDYALRYTADKARIWPARWVANTAMGSIAFLACEAIGATVTVAYGFESMAFALLCASAIFLIAGLPICYYGARYGVDMDLLTRGSGFGYLGSTITSAVYASFTFILFSIEAVILSGALKLCFGVPLPIAHLISALIVVPVAAYGFSRISRLQNWTQPVWLVLQLSPLIFLVSQGQEGLELWSRFEGSSTTSPTLHFGLALAVFLSLLPQIGEQVDYLRFLPVPEKVGTRTWWTALLMTGPGWIIVGALKIALGSYLAVLALGRGMAASDAVNPTVLYFMSLTSFVPSDAAALVLTGVFVAICQMKINVTNAYAGSIASSNFFSRLTHRHPGRAVWLVFNVFIALMLMQSGIQNVVERVLALYSNFAVAWFGAVIADLMISKPLGLSPKGIEFRRAYLYNFNPVGVGAMLLSLIVSNACFLGLLGESARVLSPLIGLAVSFTSAPLIAWATGGRYYTARTAPSLGEADIRCIVCENTFEPPDMVSCPVYQGTICSLCCTLEARCHDACKERPRWIERFAVRIRRALPAPLEDAIYARIVRFLLTYAATVTVIGTVLILIYYQRTGQGGDLESSGGLLWSVFGGLLAASAFSTWYLVLSRESQKAAEEESERQTVMLIGEIEAHGRTYVKLQRTKEAADAANLAKSRYVTSISHEIRSPLNTILGYAQLLERDPAHFSDAVRAIRRSATHLTGLIEDLMDIARIENGSIRLQRGRVNLTEMIDELADMFRLQAVARGIRFEHSRSPRLPTWVFTDERRLRQVLINLISNAIKYTPSGTASLNIRWRNSVAEFEIADTGVGIAAADIERIFLPFERLDMVRDAPGTGLGLTITKLLVDTMGGHLSVESEVGRGTIFRFKAFLSETTGPVTPAPTARVFEESDAHKILVADDNLSHRELARSILEPLGFSLCYADDGIQALELFRKYKPDLVMMDIAMPQMSGWEAARIIRAEMGDKVTILMVSANAHDLLRPRHADDPHDDYLIKPYEIDDLRDSVATLLALADTREERTAP